MKKTYISLLLFVFCLISLLIAVYQFVDERLIGGIMSLVFSSVFFTGGMLNYSKSKKRL